MTGRGETIGVSVFVDSRQGCSTLASTAVGPLAFSIARDLVGNYRGAALWFALLPTAAGIAAKFLKSARVAGI